MKEKAGGLPQRIAAAVDIGGTNIRAGLVSEEGRLLASAILQTRTGKSGAELSVQRIQEQLARQCEGLALEMGTLSGIGVVCAGPIDCERGEVQNPYTLPGWEGFALASRLRALTGLPARLDHDVNGALLGEVFLNGWQGKRVLMISFGTGIGVAVFDRDRPFRAGAKYHPEMGHIVVDALAEGDCYCRHSGCFEMAWSGKALGARANALGFASFTELFRRWQEGDSSLDAEMSRLQRLFCAGVWNLMTVFKPEILVLGGGAIRQYYPLCAEWIRENLAGLWDFVERYEVFPARQEENSPLVGASRLIFDNR